MSLADRVDALRRQHEQRMGRQRGGVRAERQALHEGGRYARWQVDTNVESGADGWLLSYLDLITLLLALLVVLLGVSRLPASEPASSQPVQLVGLMGSASSTATRVDPVEAWASAWDSWSLPEWEAAPAPGAATAPPWSDPDGGLPASPDTAATVADSGVADDGALPSPSSPPQRILAAQAPDAPAAPDPAPEPAIPSVADLGLGDLGDGVDVIVNEKTISFRISNELLFPSGQSVLSRPGLGVVRRMATVINRNPQYPVSVEGHSDSVPIQTRQFPSNWELSASRATSVLRELVRDGVDPARLRAVGYADTRPLESNDSDAGRAANRRVELIMEIVPRQESSAAGLMQPHRGATFAQPE